MRFRANLNKLTLVKGQERLVDDYIEDRIKEAARIWLDAALAIVPAWSGASRATFQALASAVDYHVSIDVAGDAPDRIGLGRLYSQGGVRRLKQGSWEFYYETQLRYLVANETKTVAPRTEGLRGTMKTPTPFKFREAGFKAVREYAKTLANEPVTPIKKLRKK
ncbi:MAG: hypothetical protein GY906_04675 [bacterium]|nr:hypothetical protein [bacterium]